MTTKAITKYDQVLIDIPDLDITKMHSPEVVREHHRKRDSAFQQIRKQEQAAQREVENLKAKANAPLTEDQYYQLKLQEHQKQKAAEAARLAELEAEKATKEAFLASSPDTVELIENNPASLGLALNHWLGRGYQIDINDIRYFQPGCYCYKLIAPTVTTKKVTAK